MEMRRNAVSDRCALGGRCCQSHRTRRRHRALGGGTPGGVRVKTAEFIASAEAYYGSYEAFVRRHVELWFAGKKFPPKTVEKLWAETIKALPRRFRMPPDVADLEASYERVRNRPDNRLELVRYQVPDRSTMTAAEAEEIVLALQDLIESIARRKSHEKNGVGRTGRLA